MHEFFPWESTGSYWEGDFASLRRCVIVVREGEAEKDFRSGLQACAKGCTSSTWFENWRVTKRH